MITTGANLPAIAFQEGHIQEALHEIARKIGRPSKYSPELAANIINQMKSGTTVTAITLQEGMPSWTTICEWMRCIPEFSESYAQAKLDRAPQWAEGALDVLENAPTESMAHVRKAEAIANQRNLLAKFDDRDTYGDKSTQDVNIKGVMISTTCGELSDLLSGK